MSELVFKESVLFRDNCGQAVLIPLEFELPGDRVLIHREGNKLVIQPVPKKKLLDILRTLKPLRDEDALPDDISTSLLSARGIEL